MATNGIISIVKDGKTIFKCVAGCNAMVAEKVADIIKKEKDLTIDRLYKICIDHDFGCKDCTVVQSENDYRSIDMEDGLAPLYKTKFSDPSFNPRWDNGTASHIVIINQ